MPRSWSSALARAHCAAIDDGPPRVALKDSVHAHLEHEALEGRRRFHLGFRSRARNGFGRSGRGVRNQRRLRWRCGRGGSGAGGLHGHRGRRHDDNGPLCSTSRSRPAVAAGSAVRRGLMRSERPLPGRHKGGWAGFIGSGGGAGSTGGASGAATESGARHSLAPKDDGFSGSRNQKDSLEPPCFLRKLRPIPR
jgi:hypothetical protein